MKRFALSLAALLLGALPSMADILGTEPADFDTFRTGETTMPTFFTGYVQLADTDEPNAAASIFSKESQDLTGPWTSRYVAYFTLPETGSPGEGFAFVLNAGPGDLGAPGADVGYGGIGNSVAIVVRTNPGGTNGISLEVNGAVSDAANVPLRIDFQSETPIAFDLFHDPLAKQIEVQVIQGANSERFVFPVDIAATIGGTSGRVGFTAGTGVAAQGTSIYNFTFIEAANAALGVTHAGHVAEGETFNDPERCGLAQITLSVKAATGTLNFAGAKYPIKTNLTPGEPAVVTLKRKGSKDETLTLTIVTEGMGRRIGLELEDSLTATTYTASLRPAVTRAAAQLTTTFGDFSVWNAAPSTAARGPRALAVTGSKGYATIKMSTRGTAKFVGQAPDGTKISAGLVAGFDDRSPIFVQLYKVKKIAKGHLAGYINTPGGLELEERAMSSDTLLVRPANYKKLYPAGVFEGLATRTSLYDPGQSPLDYGTPSGTETNARLEIAGGNADAFSTQFQYTPGASKAKFTNGTPNKEKLKFTRKTGLFSGSFKDAATKKVRKFKGVVNQADNQAGGVFIGNDRTGSVSVYGLL